MKIGILTFHRADNFGAVLQAYALVVYLRNQGHEAEIIDYYTECTTKRYTDKSRVKGNNLKMILSRRMLNERRKRFQEFRAKLNISSRTYTSKDAILESNDLYDLIIAGSDQIWNYKMTNMDATYLLDFVNEPAKKMSYASSFGVSEIDGNVKSIYQRTLTDIPRLSVRENLGADLVFKLTGRSPEVVADPCLLLSKEEWSKLNSGQRLHNRPYILVYMFTGSNLSKVISNTGFDTSGYDIVKINGNITFTDFLKRKTKVKYGIGPQEFINLIKNADLILTDSFHGTVFSVLFEKKFVTVLRDLEGKNARITDFLVPLGLKCRIFNEGMRASEVLAQPNYEKVRVKLDELVKRSKTFLNNSLS